MLFSNHRRPVKLTYGTFGRTTPETIEDEVKESETSRFHRWLEARKERMHAHPVMRHLYKPLVIGVGAFCLSPD